MSDWLSRSLPRSVAGYDPTFSDLTPQPCTAVPVQPLEWHAPSPFVVVDEKNRITSVVIPSTTPKPSSHLPEYCVDILANVAVDQPDGTLVYDGTRTSMSATASSMFVLAQSPSSLISSGHSIDIARLITRARRTTADDIYHAECLATTKRSISFVRACDKRPGDDVNATHFDRMPRVYSVQGSDKDSLSQWDTAASVCAGTMLKGVVGA